MKLEKFRPPDKTPEFIKWLRKNLDHSRFYIAEIGNGYDGIRWEIRKHKTGFLGWFDIVIFEMYWETTIHVKHPEYLSDIQDWVRRFERQGGGELTISYPES